MSKTFKPLADRVLIEPAAVEMKTASGIIIPDSAKEKPLIGKVIATGNGKIDEPMTVKVGDEVLQGDVIGTVGSTGRSTGPHLDFRINWFQTRLDPMSVLEN